MRLMMKLPIPMAGENAVVADPAFDNKLKSLLLELGAQKVYTQMMEGRRIEYVIFEIEDPARIFSIARPVHLWLKVKPEFMPDTITRPPA
jgi:hypothetical protein